MPAIYLYSHTVRPEEIDGLGHVNNVCYVSWMQDAAMAHSTEAAQFHDDAAPKAAKPRRQPAPAK